MTRTFATNENNDLFLDDSGNLALAFDRDAVLENCAHAMQTILGECVLDLPRGLPNFEAVWNGQPNLAQYNLAARLALSEVAGVLAVLSFESAQVGDTLQYRAQIQTIFGVGVIP